VRFVGEAWHLVAGPWKGARRMQVLLGTATSHKPLSDLTASSRWKAKP